MHRFMVLYPKQDDPERFRDYFLNTHLKLARTIPGGGRISYGFGVTPVGPTQEFEAVFQMDVDSAAALGAAMGSPEGQATAADVPNFASPPPLVLHFPVETD